MDLPVYKARIYLYWFFVSAGSRALVMGVTIQRVLSVSLLFCAVTMGNTIVFVDCCSIIIYGEPPLR